MLVISLIVLGFAAISRREQRQSLDQQLSTQAFYAAESAIEDARKAIEARLSTGDPLVNKDDCTGDPLNGGYPTGNATVIDSVNEVSYTCLKVNVEPKSASYDGIGEKSIIIPIKANKQIDRIEISWKPSTVPVPPASPNDCPTGVVNVFSAQPDWACRYGVLRTDLVSTSLAGGGLSRGGLAGNTLTGFYTPTNSAAADGRVSYAGGKGQPNVVASKCDTAAYGKCLATIIDVGTSTDFALRVSSLYQPSNITVTAYAIDNTEISFSGAQAIIDATGRAQDVLRRIQVRVPLKPVAAFAPNYAIQTNHALCKRFSTTPGYFNIPGDIIDKDDKNPMCVPKTDGTIPIPPCVPNQDIVLVLDESGSMKTPLRSDRTRTSMQQLQEVSRRFIAETNIAPEFNHAGIVAFASQARLGVGLTGDQPPLINFINSLVPTSGTNYTAGMSAAVDEFNSPRARPGSPRVLVFVSDGAPSGGGGKPQIRQDSTIIKDAGVRFYTIGIDNSNSVFAGSYDEQLLIDMAGNGGRYFGVNDEPSLKTALQIISSDLRCDKP